MILFNYTDYFYSWEGLLCWFKHLDSCKILIRLFILRWSCSIILLKYLPFHIFIFFEIKLLLFTVKIAELLALLLPMFSIITYSFDQNFCTDIFYLRLVNKNSTVFPYLSTASPTITKLLFSLMHILLNFLRKFEYPSLDSGMVYFYPSDWH